jgi:hypothetical protein
VLLARLLCGHRFVARRSSLRYLHELLRHQRLREPEATFWVMPSPESASRNLA